MRKNAMPNIPNPIVTPAILPTDLDLHQDDVPAEADDLESDKSDPVEEEAKNPEIDRERRPMVSSRDEADVRRLLDSYSPSSR
jgi:hypothetical protein